MRFGIPIRRGCPLTAINGQDARWPHAKMAVLQKTKASTLRMCRLHVVVHRELVGVGAEPQGVVFLLFHLKQVRDEVGIEDVAFKQETVVVLQRRDSAT